jgi:WD40 repeat protein
VATGSGDGSARVFEAATGREVSRLDHDGLVAAVAFSPESTRVATGSHDRSARVFEAATGTGQAWLGHDDAVAAVAFSPDGTRVATGSDDRSARVRGQQWHVSASRFLHPDAVNAAAFSPDGNSGWPYRQLGRSGAAVLRRYWHRNSPARPRRRGKRGGLQPRWHPGGHRQRRPGSARVPQAATGTEVARLDHDGPGERGALQPR